MLLTLSVPCRPYSPWTQHHELFNEPSRLHSPMLVKREPEVRPFGHRRIRRGREDPVDRSIIPAVAVQEFERKCRAEFLLLACEQ